MQIVIATAEPRGAYHLTPLRESLQASPSKFVHLVPYPEPLQGEVVVEPVHATSVLDNADCVVITGGTLNPWTELVAREANLRDVPLLYSELAWITAETYSSLPLVTAASAFSQAEAPRVSSMLGGTVEHTTVTGIPALDYIPKYSPCEGLVLILSTVDMTTRDPRQELLTAARKMQESGYRVRVRCHPREDRTPWSGFEIVENETQVESASSASVVIGYPGSAHVLAAAAGAPVISVEPTFEFSNILSAQETTLMSARVTAAAAVLDAVQTAVPCDSGLLESVVGPIGGAGVRMVEFWQRYAGH